MKTTFPKKIICFKAFPVYLRAIGSDRKKVNAFLFFAVEKIFRNNKPRGNYEQQHYELALRMLKRTILSIFYTIFSSFMIFGGTIYGVVMKHEYTYPFGVILPFVDPISLVGLIWNFSFQGICTAIGSLSMITLVISISLGCSTMHTMAELIKFHLQHFNENILEKKYEMNELKKINAMLEDFKSI